MKSLWLGLFALSLLSISSKLRAQSSEVGAYLLWGHNVQSANFQHLPGVPSCCPRYESGEGNGMTLAPYLRWNLEEGLSLEARLSYATFNGLLAKQEHTFVSVADVDVPALFEHSVDNRLTLLGFEPAVRYSILGSLTLTGGLGVHLITANTYSQKEVLLEPAVGTWENGRRIRNESSGETPNGSTTGISIRGALSYALPLNTSRTVLASPQLEYTKLLTPIAKDLAWTVASIRAGVSIGFILHASSPAIASATLQTEPVTESLPATQLTAIDSSHTPTLAASVSIQALVNGHPASLSDTRVEDFVRTQHIPLLNYLFFDEGSAELATRYRRVSRSEDWQLPRDSDAMHLYYEVLNIVGSRLKASPQCSISIVGCHASGLRETRQTSEARATTVRDYLRDVWKIPMSQLHVEIRDVPESPSSSTDSDGAAENRRVEIRSNNWQVLQPIVTRDTTRAVAPVALHVIKNIKSEAGVRGISTRFTINGSTVAAANPGTDYEIYSLPAVLAGIPRIEKQDTLRYELTVMDNAGQSVTSVALLPVQHLTMQAKSREGHADTAIARFSLILFDFDRDDLTPEHRKVIEEVRHQIPRNSRVTIIGYADRSGNADHNSALALARARNVASYLNVPNSVIRGEAGALPFDNRLPEGRFYSRTVVLVAESK